MRIQMNQFIRFLILYIIISLILINFTIYSEADNLRQTNRNSEIENWPFHYHDLQNTGFSSSEGPESNETQWIFNNLNDSGGSSFVAVNGIIYFGTGRPDNKFYAINANSGEEIWNYSGGDNRFGSCVYYDGIIYISYESTVAALDLSTKEIQWRFSGKPYEGDFSNLQILVDESGVYFPAIYSSSMSSRATIESAVYRLDRNTGLPIFKFNMETNVLASTGLAIYGNRIYFGTSSHEIYCIDKIGNNDGTLLKDGTTNLLWKKFLPDDNKSNPIDIYSEPLISMNRLFVGGNKNFYSLNLSNGEEFWNYSTSDRITSTAAVDHYNVFVASKDGYLFCLNKTTGNKIWKYNSNQMIDGTGLSIASNNKIYFTTTERKLYCIDSKKGFEVWTYQLVKEIWQYHQSSPVIYDGSVYVRCGNLFKFGPKLNTKPYFTKVEVEKSIANFSEEIDIIIEAMDDEGDEINFEYGCNGGKIEKFGLKWLWTAPNNIGIFDVYFNISDGKLSNSLVLQFEVVKPNEPPLITNISIKPNIIEPNNASNIIVTAIDKDGDELEYIYGISYGKIVGSGPNVKWQAPNREGIYEIKISVFDGDLYSIIEIVNITVFKNYAPIIQDINYFPIEIYINSKINISIMAIDKNNDLLNYYYKIEYGNMIGNGSNLSWSSPSIPGEYTLQFWVDDGKLTSKMFSLNLTVMEHNKPPIIEDIIIESAKVKPDETVKIEVIAMDPNINDNISYFYKYDGDYIFNEGNIINWKAPSKIGQYEISIMVKDSFDGVVYDNITIIVTDKNIENDDSPSIISIIFFVLLIIFIFLILLIFIIHKRRGPTKIKSKNKPIEVEPIEITEKK